MLGLRSSRGSRQPGPASTKCVQAHEMPSGGHGVLPPSPTMARQSPIGPCLEGFEGQPSKRPFIVNRFKFRSTSIRSRPAWACAPLPGEQEASRVHGAPRPDGASVTLFTVLSCGVDGPRGFLGLVGGAIASAQGPSTTEPQPQAFSRARQRSATELQPQPIAGVFGKEFMEERKGRREGLGSGLRSESTAQRAPLRAHLHSHRGCQGGGDFQQDLKGHGRGSWGKPICS